MQRASGLVACLLALALLLVGPPSAAGGDGLGCNPVPDRPSPPPGPAPSVEIGPPSRARLRVDRASVGPPLAGVGLNLEPTLWSCPAFQPVLGRDLLDPLRVPIVRLSLAQTTWLPPGAGPDDLNWQVEQAVLAGSEFESTWQLIAHLNARGIAPIVLHWGAPGLMTDDGTQFGRLRPEYYVAYAEYEAAPIDYAVRQRGLKLLAASPMNEPDCGDGSKIPPEDYPTVLKLVAERVRPYGVGVYAPDTCSPRAGLAYLDALLADPAALAQVDFLGVHQYGTEPDLARFVAYARGAGLQQPIYVSEFTSMAYGNLDGGQEASDELGFTLDALAILRSHLLAGADAALYWDAVDYLQRHHGTITKWGLLAGPAEGFTPRRRYAAFRQLLPYLGPGARLLAADLGGDSALRSLAVRPPPETGAALLLALINPGGPVSLSIELPGDPAVTALAVRLTDATHADAELGAIQLDGGQARIAVPARSAVTLIQGQE